MTKNHSDKSIAPQDTPEANTETGESAVLELVLFPDEGAASPITIEGIVVGRVVSTTDTVRVTFPGAPEVSVMARSMIALAPSDVGAEVALMFERGDPSKPVLLGKMEKAFSGEAVTVVRDKESLVLEAEQELSLKCGESSITLTRSGKIIIRGNYVLSRSSGVNRIQGGSVEIN